VEPDSSPSRKEQLAHLLAPPPRAVPLPLRLQVLFGGILNLFGWIFFGFGMIFFWAFAMNSDLTSFARFRGPLETATGVVVHSYATNASENKRRIYGHEYAFEYNGRDYQGVSYATGRQIPAGLSAQIEFPAGNPEVSRIQGMRRGMFGPAVVFVVIFPFVGLCFLVFGLRSGLRAAHLLGNGQLAFGTLASKVPTNTRVNNQTVYKLTFDFATDDGRRAQAVARSHQPHRLEDEARECLFYDPARPERAVLFDSLPGSPRITSSGNFDPEWTATALLSLLPVLLTVLGHGTYLFFRYLR
jgi:hypothetical protein